MTTQITPFDFNSHPVRVINGDDHAWFVAADVAEALEYRMASDMTRNLDDDEKGTQIVRTPSGDQKMAVLNESGVYHAVLKSRKPSAKAFRKWVTAEVLPAIRKTGRYEAPKPETLTPAQQRHIQQLVNKLAHQPGNSHANVYRSLKDKFMVGRYDQIPAEQYPAACRYLGAEPLEGEWIPAEGNEAGETIEQVVAKLTEQVKKPNSYPASLFLPLVDAVLGRMGGVPPMPEAQWREIDARLSRLGQLFHPLSSQFEDVLGISRALRGMDPVSGARQEGFGRLARR